ncbi:MAG: DUF3592 domain-containing protein [Lewinellaceae bacterium]|nr:DUF3592 domain-containing protein [Lewinellaceae bacterium]MCC6282930.1 DUF3592 domain-containing protein [Saprospiraceae bacterium]
MSHVFPLCISALFACLGTFFAYHGFKELLRCILMFRAGLRTEGTVTDIKTELRTRKGRTWIQYTAVISFETCYHQKRKVEYADAFTNKQRSIGDKVHIWYHETDPEAFTLGGWFFFRDMLSFLIPALCFGLPGWTLFVHLIKGIIF